jgi:hypothetical protein
MFINHFSQRITQMNFNKALGSIFVSMLLSNSGLHATDKAEIERLADQLIKESKVNVDELKFMLCHDWLEGHLFGPNRVQNEIERAHTIHKRLRKAVAEKAAVAEKNEEKMNENKNENQYEGINFEAVGKSLEQNLDAPIVNQCVILEQRMKATGKAGTVHLDYDVWHFE